MSLRRWRPGRDLLSLRDEMGNLLDEFFSGRTWPGRASSLFEGEWTPSVDVAESDGDIVVTAELPGIAKDDVDISLSNDVLTIKGEKKEEKETKEENYHRIERRYGSFQRSIPLATGVQGDKAKANFKDGVLCVTIPKSEEARPKQIEISVE